MFKYKLPSTEGFEGKKVRGRYIEGGGWKSQAVAILNNEQVLVRCILFEKSNSLATPESLKSVNWLLDNFDKAIHSALEKEKIVYENTIFMLPKDTKLTQNEFAEECFKNGFGSFVVMGYASGEVEIDLDIRVKGKSFPTQILWRGGKVSEVTNND